MPVQATVFGASTNHGHSIVQALVASQYHVKAVVTSESHTIEGAELIILPSDNDALSIGQAIEGAGLVYISTQTDFTNPNCVRNELEQGQVILDSCRDSKVSHVILNTQLSPRDALGIVAKHCDVKSQIEEYANSLRLPLTSIEFPFLYESLYSYFRPEMIGPDSFRLAIPMGRQSMDCISTRDIGPIIAHVAAHAHSFLHKTLALAADKISIREMAAVLSKTCGLHVIDRQITVHEFKELGWPGCTDVANYFDFITRVDQKFSVTSTKELHPEALCFQDWVHTYKEEIMENCFTKRRYNGVY